MTDGIGQALVVNIEISPNFTLDEVGGGAHLEQVVRQTLREVGWDKPAEITVVLEDDSTIQALNRQYRGIDAPTDVLAFPQQGSPDSPFVAAPEAAHYLGDVIISIPRAREQAADQGHPLPAELAWLLAHGTLHLLGYDHPTEETAERMEDIQERVLTHLGLAP